MTSNVMASPALATCTDTSSAVRTVAPSIAVITSPGVKPAHGGCGVSGRWASRERGVGRGRGGGSRASKLARARTGTGQRRRLARPAFLNLDERARPPMLVSVGVVVKEEAEPRAGIPSHYNLLPSRRPVRRHGRAGAKDGHVSRLGGLAGVRAGPRRRNEPVASASNLSRAEPSVNVPGTRHGGPSAVPKR